MINFNEYQEKAVASAFYPGRGELLGLMYCALKLNGEAGEVAEKIGKVARDKEGDFSEKDIAALTRELGDVLWYIAALAREFDIPLAEVAAGNLRKLAERKERGTLAGSGDDR